MMVILKLISFVFWRYCTDIVLTSWALQSIHGMFFSKKKKKEQNRIFIFLLYLPLVCVVSTSNTPSGMPVARGEAEGMQCEQGTDADE